MLDHKSKMPPITYNTNGTTEWFTPPAIVDAARQVLGTIDLDPASCELANQTVRAEKIFTATDDGLKHDWHGRVFLNPPYTRGLCECFADKLVDEYDAGNVSEAILLVDNATDTQWFRRLADNCSGVVFTTGRTKFLKNGNKAQGSPTRGQAIFYFGYHADDFFQAFAEFGFCCEIVTRRKINRREEKYTLKKICPNDDDGQKGKKV